MIETVKTEKELSKKLTLQSIVYQHVSNFFVKNIPYLPSDEKYNLTISHQKRFVWFRVAKVGTRTVFNMLEKSNIKLSAEHAKACYYPVKLYKKYFKFAFVRNPWDRLVSCWHNKVVEENYFKFSKDDLEKMQDFKNFVDFISGKNIEKCDPHIRLQSKLIDLNQIDFIGRFETFNRDLTKVIKSLKLGSIPIEIRNATLKREHYRAYYDKSIIEKVAKIYSKDINIFAYRF